MNDALTEPNAPDKLYEHHRQQLSAMLDGALSPDAARFMLRRLQHDSELAACWERWQVCGDVLRGQRHALLPADFAQRVAGAIAAERTTPVRATAGSPRWARWGGGAALAASVAVATLFVARQAPGPANPGSGDAPAQVVVAAPPAAAARTPSPQSSNSALPDAGPQLVAAALATAEVPRRAVERRSRGQSQRAALRAPSRGSGATAVAAAVGAPAIAPALPDIGLEPFVGESLPPSGRPWPRAILPSYPASGGVAVDYGGAGARSSFHPFEPRVPAQDEAAADATERVPQTESASRP